MFGLMVMTLRRLQFAKRRVLPERNNIPDLLTKWEDYKRSGFKEPPGVEGGTLLKAGSEEPQCWWVTVKTILENDCILATALFKPLIAENVPNDDPAELIRETLAIENDITSSLEMLLQDMEVAK